MSLHVDVPVEITLVDDNANGGWWHSNNHCTVGTDDVHKINDEPGLEYDGNGTDLEVAQGHIHAFWADSTGPNTADVRVKFQEIGPVFAVQSVKLYVRAWRSGGTYTGAQFRPYLWLLSDPTDPLTGAKYYLDPATWELMPDPGDIDGAYVHAPFGGPNDPGEYFIGAAYLLNFSDQNPATLAPWKRNDLNAMQAGVEAKNDDDTLSTGPFVGTIRREVVASSSPDQQEQAQEVASRYEYLHRQGLSRLEGMPVRHSISHALMPGDILKVVHFAGPEGWRILPSLQRRFLITNMELGDDGVDIVSGVEWQDVPATYYDSLLMESNIEVATEDGILRISSGQKRLYSRAGQAWELDPGSGTYVRVEANERPYASRGLACFEEYANVIPFSAMAAGDVTGWAKAGDGVNASEIRVGDEATGALLGETIGWDKDTTGVLQSVLFIAGTPHAADMTLTATVTVELPAGTKGAWQATWTRYIPDQKGYAALVRGVDGFYLQGDGAWDAAPFWHDLTADNLGTRLEDPTSSVESWAFGRLIDVGGANTTLAHVFAFPDGHGIPNFQATRFYHAQFVPSTTLLCPPPIVTDADPVTRSAGLATIDNGVAARAMLLSGTFGAVVTTAWRGSDQPDDARRYAWSAKYDSDNLMAVYFVRNRTGDAFTGWVLWVRSGGTDYEAKVDASAMDVWPDLPTALVAVLNGAFPPVAGDELKMRLLLVGMDRLPAHSYARVIKSEQAAYAEPIPTDEAEIQLGSMDGAGFLGGHVKILRSAAQVLSDAECARFER